MIRLKGWLRPEPPQFHPTAGDRQRPRASAPDFKPLLASARCAVTSFAPRCGRSSNASSWCGFRWRSGRVSRWCSPGSASD